MQNANQEESYSGNKNSKPMHTCPNPSQNGVKIALIPSTTSGSCSHTYQNRRNQKHRQVALLMHTELWISYRFKQSPLCSGDIYTKSCDLWLISFSLNLWYAINLRKQRLNLLSVLAQFYFLTILLLITEVTDISGIHLLPSAAET